MSRSPPSTSNQFQLLKGYISKPKHRPKFYVKRMMKVIKLKDIKEINDGELSLSCNSTIRVKGGDYITTGDGQYIVCNPDTRKVTQVDVPVNCRYE